MAPEQQPLLDPVRQQALLDALNTLVEREKTFQLVTVFLLLALVAVGVACTYEYRRLAKALEALRRPPLTP
jgi:hypothetical protein